MYVYQEKESNMNLKVKQLPMEGLSRTRMEWKLRSQKPVIVNLKR